MNVWYVEVHKHIFLHRHFYSLFVIINTVICTCDVSRLKKEALFSSENSYFSSASLHWIPVYDYLEI
jgi:hypothetical protein